MWYWTCPLCNFAISHIKFVKKNIASFGSETLSYIRYIAGHNNRATIGNLLLGFPSEARANANGPSFSEAFPRNCAREKKSIAIIGLPKGSIRSSITTRLSYCHNRQSNSIIARPRLYGEVRTSPLCVFCDRVRKILDFFPPFFARVFSVWLSALCSMKSYFLYVESLICNTEFGIVTHLRIYAIISSHNSFS